MILELKAVQARALVRLAFTEGGKVARLTDLKPKLTPKDRQKLVQARLLETGKGPKGAKSLELTEAGWRWVSENLSRPMPKGSELLGDVLRYVDRFLKSNEAALVDLVSARNIRPGRQPENGLPGGAANFRQDAFKQLLLKESLGLNNGRANQRVRLSDLRPRLGFVPREVVDGALFELQNEGAIVLYPIDYAPDITAADEEACVRVGGEPRHILYVQR